MVDPIGDTLIDEHYARVMGQPILEAQQQG